MRWIIALAFICIWTCAQAQVPGIPCNDTTSGTQLIVPRSQPTQEEKDAYNGPPGTYIALERDHYTCNPPTWTLTLTDPLIGTVR